jgi:hypothetical protein
MSSGASGGAGAPPPTWVRGAALPSQTAMFQAYTAGAPFGGAPGGYGGGAGAPARPMFQGYAGGGGGGSGNIHYFGAAAPASGSGSSLPSDSGGAAAASVSSSLEEGGPASKIYNAGDPRNFGGGCHIPTKPLRETQLEFLRVKEAEAYRAGNPGEAALIAAAAATPEGPHVKALREALEAAVCGKGPAVPTKIIMVICHGALTERRAPDGKSYHLPVTHFGDLAYDMNAVAGGLVVVAGTPGAILTNIAVNATTPFFANTRNSSIEDLQRAFPALTRQVTEAEIRADPNLPAPDEPGLAADVASRFQKSIAFVAPAEGTSIGPPPPDSPPGTPGIIQYEYTYPADDMTTTLDSGDAFREFITDKRSQTLPTGLRYPLESFAITCTPMTPSAAGRFGGRELDAATFRILNYTLYGPQPKDPSVIKDMIGIWELNEEGMHRYEDLMDISANPTTTDDMIKRIVSGYSWKGDGDPYTLRIVMQHCGVIESSDPFMHRFYRQNSDLVLQHIPKIAIYNNDGALLPMLVKHFSSFFTAGGSRRTTKKRTKSKRARKTRRNAVHSRRDSIYRRGSRASRISTR